MKYTISLLLFFILFASKISIAQDKKSSFSTVKTPCYLCWSWSNIGLWIDSPVKFTKYKAAAGLRNLVGITETGLLVNLSATSAATGNLSVGHTALPLFELDLISGYMRGKVRLRTDNSVADDILRVARADGSIMWDLENVNSNTDLRFSSASRSNVIFFPRTSTTPHLLFGTATTPQDNGNATGTSHVFANTSSGTSTYGISSVCDMALIVTDLNTNGSVRGGGMEFWSYNITTSTQTPGARIRTLYNSAGDRKFGLQFSVNNNTNTTQTGYQGMFEAMRIRYDGNVGIGVSNPTAVAHLKAGTAVASTAPFKYEAGTNLSVPENGAKEFDGSNEFLSVGGVRYTLSKTLTATATLDFGNTAAGTSTDLTITITGAALGDIVDIGVPNGSTVANGCFTGWVSASNTVKIRFSNNDLTTAYDPASGTFRAAITKY